MKEKPILFSGPMVRALLREIDPKTQTRRVVKGTALRMLDDGFTPGFVADPGNSAWCPYGKAGDRLWVRETWAKPPDGVMGRGDNRPALYAADYPPMTQTGFGPWRPSIHMYRCASRITLEIAEVRVQRVQEISEADAIAEGCKAEPMTVEGIANLQISDASPFLKQFGKALGPGVFPATADFRFLWNSINAKRGFGWDVNPWVWAISFQRVSDGTSNDPEERTTDKK